MHGCCGPGLSDLREPIMSYFHEYARKEHKSLRAHSRTIYTRRFPERRVGLPTRTIAGRSVPRSTMRGTILSSRQRRRGVCGPATRSR